MASVLDFRKFLLSNADVAKVVVPSARNSVGSL